MINYSVSMTLNHDERYNKLVRAITTNVDTYEESAIDKIKNVDFGLDQTLNGFWVSIPAYSGNIVFEKGTLLIGGTIRIPKNSQLVLDINKDTIGVLYESAEDILESSHYWELIVKQSLNDYRQRVVESMGFNGVIHVSESLDKPIVHIQQRNKSLSTVACTIDLLLTLTFVGSFSHRPKVTTTTPPGEVDMRPDDPSAQTE